MARARRLNLEGWKGVMLSRPPQQVPLDYMAGGSNFLYIAKRRTFKRRLAQAIQFDTYGAPQVGLLPSLMGVKGRQLEEFTSDGISDHIPTLIALATKETMGAGVLDDGSFACVYVRDQVLDTNYTMGSEFSSTTYPDPGPAAEQTYKYQPLWYDSGDGGLTRGISEFQRRFLVSGSRRGFKADRWVHHPSALGTPSKWLPGGVTEASEGTAITATGDVAPTGGTPATGFGNQGSASGGQWITSDAETGAHYTTGWQNVAVDDAGSATQRNYVFVNNNDWVGGNNWPVIATLTFPTLTSATKRWRISMVVQLNTSSSGAYTGANTNHTFTPRLVLSDGNGYTASALRMDSLTQISATAPGVGTYQTVEFDIDTNAIAPNGGLTANTLQLRMDDPNTGLNGLGFKPFFGITYIEVVPLGAGSGAASRLAPSGPWPALHAGVLTKGTQIENNEAFIYPNADVSNAGSWTRSNDAGTTNLYQMLNTAPSADTGDYISSPNAMVERSCEIALETPAAVPAADATVVVRFYVRGGGTVPAAAEALVYLKSNGVIVKTMSVLPLAAGDFQLWAFTLSPTEIAAVTSNSPTWADVTLAFSKLDSGADACSVQVASARIGALGAGESSEGGWKGSDTFYRAVAFRDEHGAIWMPTTPRGENSILASGYNLFTVDPDNPTAGYESVLWTKIPIGPYGTQSRLLLRSDKIDIRTDSKLQLSEFRLFLTKEIKDNSTTSYEDFGADDDTLEDDPDELFIHFDHKAPPRARYGFAGPSRICHAYGGDNPAAIIFAPVGVSADYDRNLADDDAALFAYPAVYYQVTTTALTIKVASDATTIAKTMTFAFATYNTLEKLVDAINATAVSATDIQLRAQLAPDANSNADPATALMPTSRPMTACTVSGQTISRASGLSAIPVGAFVDPAGTGVTAPAYVSKINSDVLLTFVGTINTTGNPKTLTFVAGTGDVPTTALTQYSGWVRMLGGCLFSTLYFNKTYLDQFPLEKSSIWMTSAPPGSFKSAPNSFVTRDDNRFRPPTEAGISMGGVAVGNGFVVPFSKQSAVITNERDQGTFVDKDYHLFIRNPARGCCAWQSVAAGNGFATFYTFEGLVAADLRRERVISRDIYEHADNDSGSGFGAFDYITPLCVAASGMDDDSADLYVRVERGRIYVNYLSAAGVGQQIVYDFLDDENANGLDDVLRGGWGTELDREGSVMCSGRRDDGEHLYMWNDDNEGSVGDGRIDEIEVGDTDNGTAISASVRSPWIRGDGAALSFQEVDAIHNTPTGATTSLVFHRGYEDDPYTLTSTVSGSLIVTDELIRLPQGARVTTIAGYLEWLQTAGGASELEKFRLKLLDLKRGN